MAQQGAVKMMTAADAATTTVADLAPPVPVADVSDGGVVDPPPSPLEDEGEHHCAVLGEQDDEEESDLSDADEEDSSDEDDDDDASDDEDDLLAEANSDSEFEADDQPPPPQPEVAIRDVQFATATFLGQPARMATLHSTVAFMRLAECYQYHAAPGAHGEIVVNYRYTRFSRARRGGGVAMHALGPKQARVRFLVPSPVPPNPASTLRLAGASLAPLLYPPRFSEQLQAMWLGLVMMAPMSVSPRAARFVVTVDMGILRPGHCTPKRMERMWEAMQSVARERDAHPVPYFDAETELQLPAPLTLEDDVRPTKRRRVTGEDCPICYEVLEKGLVAWPRCSHIFHGRCLEQHLLRGHQGCPLCRSDLKLASTH